MEVAMSTKNDEVYVRQHETAVHTVTYWHGQITVCVPASEGGWYEHSLRCTHDHESRALAQSCENRMARLARRHGDEITGWAEWVTRL